MALNELNQPSDPSEYASMWRVFLPPSFLSLSALILYNYTNFLAFHTVAESFSIFIGLTLVTVASTSTQFTRNQLIVFIAIASGWCAGLDFIHLLVYKGVTILPFQTISESTQLWVVARFIQAVAFLVSPIFLYRKLPVFGINILFGVVSISLTGAIILGEFPVTFVEGVGVTHFKSNAEVVIIIILLMAILNYWRLRSQMSRPLFNALFASMITMTLSEGCFVYYVNLYGIENIAGHLLKIYAYWFIYVGLVIATLRQPFSMLARAASTYNTIPESTLIIKFDGLIYQANEAAGQYTQSSPEELVGLSSHRLFHNKSILMEHCAVCNRIRAGGERFIVELDRGDGRWVECSLTPIKSTRYIDGWVEVVRDITANKRLEIEKNRMVDDINKRIKELSCLYAITTLSASKGVSIEKLLQETVLVLPSALQFPQRMGVKIESDWGDFYSNSDIKNIFYNFKTAIIVDELQAGFINVFYLEEKPVPKENILREEQVLLDAITKHLGDAISRILAVEKRTQLTYLYEMLSSCNRAALRCTNEAELVAALFDAMLRHGAFDLLFIAMKKANTKQFVIVHYHGIPTDDLRLLDHAILNTEGSIGSFVTPLESGKVINISKDFHWVPDEWTDNLGARGISDGFIIPLKSDNNLVGFIVAYGKSLNLAGDEQANLLNQIAADASFALTGFSSNERRKLAETKAALSEYRFSEVFMASPVPMQILSKQNNSILSINKAFEMWFGFSEDEVTQDKDWVQRFWGENSALAREAGFWQRLPSREDTKQDSGYPEVTVYDSNKIAHIVRILFLSLDDEIVLFLVDLTDIRAHETALREREQNFRRLIEQPFEGVYVRDEHQFIYTNPRFCELIGYKAAELQNKTLPDLLIHDESAKALVIKSWQIMQRTQAPLSYLLNFERKDGKKIILGIHGTPLVWESKPAVLALVQDVTEAEQARQQINHYVLELKEAIKGTFHAVSNMVEIRDPYTAGHEHRVGLIARAIAKEMGWPESRCDALELIGLVHDIGKISVPAELLSKPGKLSPMEMELVKGHARAGYEILKDIKFDAPVAEAIYQHHERLDGSGYPRGLKGDQIIPEARIVIVADVLEAMSSHRPYRPSLGIEAAIEELLQGRDKLYDSLAVDTLVKLIREQGYQIPM